MAYQEYDFEYFDCERPGCGGSVEVNEQKTLHWMHKNGMERPRGASLCDECKDLIETASVDCENRPIPGLAGDRGCVGNGQIRLMDRGYRVAKWFVMSGMDERPRTEPFCDVCLRSVVYSCACRNVGCRGNGMVGQTGKQKMDTLFVAQKTGQPYTPPTRCQPCKDFLDACRDEPLSCEVCKRSWLFTVARQHALVAGEPKERFIRPKRCDGCAALSEDEVREEGRRARAAERRGVASRAWSRLLATADRARMGTLQKESFDAALRQYAKVPDADVVAREMHAAAIDRIGRTGVDGAMRGIETSLKTRGVAATPMARALANSALRDDQAAQLAIAFGRLGATGTFPARLFSSAPDAYELNHKSAMAGIFSIYPHIAQAAAFEIYAAASIMNNRNFPVLFSAGDIVSFEHRQNVDPDYMGRTRSFEADLLVERSIMGVRETTLIDFKHSTIGSPPIKQETVDKMVHALTHGHVDHAILVVNCALTQGNKSMISAANAKIEEYNQLDGAKVNFIEVFTQEW